MQRDMDRDAAIPRQSSSIWDRSFLLGILALFSAGTLLTLDHLLSPRSAPEAGLGDDDAADPGADADADADD
jgi:hypothetical protein